LTVFFALLGSASVKAVSRTLVKLTLGVDQSHYTSAQFEFVYISGKNGNAQTPPALTLARIWSQSYKTLLSKNIL